MVNIIDRSLSEIENERIGKKMADIAKKTLLEYSVNDDYSIAFLTVRKPTGSGSEIAFHIYPLNSRIEVYKENYLAAAVNLATSYEREFPSTTFTVKRQFN